MLSLQPGLVSHLVVVFLAVVVGVGRLVVSCRLVNLHLGLHWFIVVRLSIRRMTEEL